jgi:hypothetical protein
MQLEGKEVTLIAPLRHVRAFGVGVSLNILADSRPQSDLNNTHSNHHLVPSTSPHSTTIDLSRHV